MTFEALLELLQTPEQSLEFAYLHSVLQRNFSCTKCHIPMTHQRYVKSPDQWCLRCPKCGKRQTVRQNSVIENSKLSLKEFFVFVFQWAHDDRAGEICHELGITSSTATRLLHKLKSACILWKENRRGMIGGTGHIVQIDETQLSRKKHDRGRPVPGSDVWIFGGIDTVTDGVFMEWVRNRSGETLIPVIMKNIRPGTIIHSDSWGVQSIRAIGRGQSIWPPGSESCGGICE